MSTCVKFAGFMGIAALATLMICDQSAEAGRRHRHRHCCDNYGYGNYYGGCSNGCGNFDGQWGQAPCQSGACGVQQPVSNPCSPCGPTTMNQAQPTGYEYSAARPTYRDPNQPQFNGQTPDQFNRDQYLRDQRMNNPEARNMTDDQILRQRDLQLQSDDSVREQQQDLRQDQRQINRNLNETNRDVNRNLNDANRQIDRNIDRAGQNVPAPAAPKIPTVPNP